MDQPARLLPRGVNSIESRIGGLFYLRILARSFPQSFARFGHIEDVIDDLKRQADAAAIVTERVQLPVTRPRDQGAAARGGCEQRARFGAVNEFQNTGTYLFPFRFDIDHLPADHSVDGS